MESLRVVIIHHCKDMAEAIREIQSFTEAVTKEEYLRC
jgi:uncharacterized protein with HEPN domain